MKILILNDDGFDAIGLVSLVNALKDEHQLYVCAPLKQNSGMGHALTAISRKVKVERFSLEGTQSAFKVDGTPADCAIIACSHLYKEIDFDLVISGINDGANLGEDVIYSGTVSAAHVAYLAGNHAIAISLFNPDYHQKNDFTFVCEHFKEFIKTLDYSGDYFLYNINYPHRLSPKAVVYAEPSQVKYKDRIEIDGTDDDFTIRFYGKPYNVSLKQGNDFELLEKGYATLVPLKFSVKDDKTDSNIEKLKTETSF